MGAFNRPAAGAKGGPAPLPAGLQVPAYLRLEGDELHAVLGVLRDPLAGYLYLLLLVQMRFTDGEFMASYARLMELCTPPQPERGRRRYGPTYKQLRRAVDDLAAVGLVHRGDGNEAQGQLRLFLTPRKNAQKPALAFSRPSK